VRKILVVVAGAFLLNTALAKEDEEDFEIVLPEDAQKCVLPASPDAIPKEATYDQLKTGKAQIATFQTEVLVFRECLQAAEENPDNTAGNKQAIVDSFSYSVDMEERIAVRFNEAIRSYKERKAASQ
jgi:hypothetical protein